MSRWRQTSFGRMKTLSFAGTEVELLRFDSPGRHHTHDEWEYALCLRGEGVVKVGESLAVPAGPHDIVPIPPGVKHRMIPKPGTGPYEWILWYNDAQPGLVTEPAPTGDIPDYAREDSRV